MRHRKVKIRLGRELGHRKMLMRQLATSLVLYDEIETTVTKAKLLRPKIERLVTVAKKDTLTGRRRVASVLTHKNAVKKLFEVIGPKFGKRDGGYTRIRKTRTRAGDSAELATISFVE